MHMHGKEFAILLQKKFNSCLRSLSTYILSYIVTLLSAAKKVKSSIKSNVFIIGRVVLCCPNELRLKKVI